MIAIKLFNEITKLVKLKIIFYKSRHKEPVIRSEEQLFLQAKILNEIVQIFKVIGVPPLVTDGVVLGYLREGDFIKWDPDVDFFIDLKNATNNKDRLIDLLLKKEFKIISVNNNFETWKIRAVKCNYFVEIRAWSIKDNYWSRHDLTGRHYLVPTHFFSETRVANLRGVKFLVPSETTDYLKYMYGDWQTPIQSNNYDQFTNMKFR